MTDKKEETTEEISDVTCWWIFMAIGLGLIISSPMVVLASVGFSRIMFNIGKYLMVAGPTLMILTTIYYITKATTKSGFVAFIITTAAFAMMYYSWGASIHENITG